MNLELVFVLVEVTKVIMLVLVVAWCIHFGRRLTALERREFFSSLSAVNKKNREGRSGE